MVVVAGANVVLGSFVVVVVAVVVGGFVMGVAVVTGAAVVTTGGASVGRGVSSAVEGVGLAHDPPAPILGSPFTSTNQLLSHNEANPSGKNAPALGPSWASAVRPLQVPSLSPGTLSHKL
ncbi:hypothetical protein, variant [Aphanomyces astaci]|uniref:Uncharacterized protein n=1 Tax=Aphanomyces astaci TaxID=112090 RepID=W4FSY5_APHAT|nr:hypothetical protein H257_13987 [Aphanomyces astaci]XP_009839998.1 hypothetical protein, variant [Aphanomyces astaci]ETV70614.1 hypothetical protein H257_13987 [Aphanomyces astaci]ETV70615.1 hypothetical protein, variant [Aphanomyces astaci]|eukprot:XP_009839997.1 hypothetical protein H257_13987 [Aphanomyces astaci]